jgi:UDP-glucose:(heptosyl)LPS alpha-1,3-glucosyltransferase
MKVALIVHDLHETGGHSLYARVLADGFSRSHEVEVFANTCVRPADARWDVTRVRAWRANALSTVRTFPAGLSAHAARLSEFDIVHSQGYCGGKPNVVTAHICVAAYLASLHDVKLVNRISLRAMAAAEERFYRQFKGTVIAVSKNVARELREFYQVSCPIHVLPHGVNAERFARVDKPQARAALRSRLKIHAKESIALYVGDLTKAHTHLKALASVSPETQIVIVTRSRDYLWQAPNVHFLPPTDRIEEYYRGADVFVFPTTYDAFGMVVLEAMAAGLPVFSSDRAGASELIETGADGFVFSLDSWVEKTADCLSRAWSLKEVGRSAAEKARKLGWDSVLSSVERVYHDVVVSRAALSANSIVSRHAW